MRFEGLGFLTDAQQQRRAVQKGKTRLELKTEARPLTRIDEKAFRAAVWARDGNRCRCCHRKVDKVLGRVPERGEVHHIHGRGKDLRFEVRAAILLCLKCHEIVTGRIKTTRLFILPTKTFTMRDDVYTDATFPVVFTEKAP